MSELASDIMHEDATAFMLAGYFVIQAKQWLAALGVVCHQSCKRFTCTKRFESAGKTALYMALALVDSLCVNAAVFAFVGAPPEAGPTFVVRE